MNEEIKCNEFLMNDADYYKVTAVDLAAQTVTIYNVRTGVEKSKTLHHVSKNFKKVQPYVMDKSGRAIEVRKDLKMPPVSNAEKFRSAIQWFKDNL